MRAVLLLSIVALLGVHGWQWGTGVNPAEFEMSMTMIFIVALPNGEYVSNGHVAAFIGGELRGLANDDHRNFGLGPYRNITTYNLIIYGHSGNQSDDNEKVRLTFWNGTFEWDVTENFPFVADSHPGTHMLPEKFTTQPLTIPPSSPPLPKTPLPPSPSSPLPPPPSPSPSSPLPLPPSPPLPPLLQQSPSQSETSDDDDKIMLYVILAVAAIPVVATVVLVVAWCRCPVECSSAPNKGPVRFNRI